MLLGSLRSCCAVVLFGSLLAAWASAEPPAVEAAPPAAGEFEAHWSVEGTRDALDFGETHSQAIFRHTGTLKVMRSDGLLANALSKCIGLSDSVEGSRARCVWLTGLGDEIYSVMERDTVPGAQGGRGTGRIVGGAGRFAGISGSYELTWVARPSSSQAASIAGDVLAWPESWVAR